MEERQGQKSAQGRTLGVVVSRWNELITKELLEGALDELRSMGDPKVIVAKVPGAWEVPVAAKSLLDRGCEGVACLGCIIQGETSHAGQLAGDVSSALMSLQMSTGKPVAWGILTPENQEQALDRSGLKVGHKGREAASALVEMVSLLDG